MHVSSLHTIHSVAQSPTRAEAGQGLLMPRRILGPYLRRPETVAAQPRTDDLRQLTAWLETLPLATGEYATARNRIHNASRYVGTGEFGAARYELRLVAGQLRQHLAD